jgi:luciferase family oxidoreductase group 1
MADTAAQSRVPLSVLDLVPVGEGSTPADALANSVLLAQLVEELGYHRLWVAEHHNMPGIGSSSPPVLIAHLAASTSTIRVGAGGVMLPNHASLVVAEQFGMLEALHPGRVDLGIGRAPGTDAVTAAALRRGGNLAADDFPEQLRDLLQFFDGTYPRIIAMPGRGYRPALWMLGSSDYSAQVAGLLGLPFSFAHHFASHATMGALAAYRATFRPSSDLGAPYTMIGVPVICADTSERARWLAASNQLSFVRLRQGRPTALPTPEEAAEYVFTPSERALLQSWTAPQIIGDPGEVRAGLTELVARTEVDELMITTTTHNPVDRRHSYELVAQAWGLESRRRD